MSLYIPRVFANITEKRIMDVFEKNEIGKVNHVDFVTKMGKDAKVYNSAYVHFDFWFDNVASQNIQDKLETGNETKIMYDDPWFWFVYKNTTKKNGGNGPRKERLTIDLNALKKAPEQSFTNPLEEGEEQPEFTQEELDEIDRNIFEEFMDDDGYRSLTLEDLEEIEKNPFEDFDSEEEHEACFNLVDAEYAGMLEARLAYYEYPCWIFSF